MDTNPTHIATQFLDWTAGPLAGWTYKGEIKKWFQGEFRNLHTLERECPTCGNVIKIDVTARAITGQAINHGLALRRCKKCREALKTGGAQYDARRQMGESARTAPVEAKPAAQAVVPADNAEMQREIEDMRIELDGLYERYKLVFDELQPLKAENKILRDKLAKYELPAAMAAKTAAPAFPSLKPQLGFNRPIGCEPVQNTTGSKLTFPWQSD